MLIHLPIAMMAVLSPVAVSDTMPTFDIVRECHFESEATREAFDRCSNQENDARQRLQQEWGKYVAVDKRTCIAEMTIGGFVSYVELLICLELVNDVRSEGVAPRIPVARDKLKRAGQELPGMTVGEGRRPR